MFRFRRNKHIVPTLRDRELHYVPSAFKVTSNVIFQLIRSDFSIYKNIFNRSSLFPITYENGYIYYNDYKECHITNGTDTKPIFYYHLQRSKAKAKIGDVVTYSTPVYGKFDECVCGYEDCICFSRFLMSISEDNWMCQHHTDTGQLLKEVYVKCANYDNRFKYIDWNVYGKSIVLTSTLNPGSRSVRIGSNVAPDAVVIIAIFTVFPLEFHVLLEIKRSLFGKTCCHANVCDDHLILGMSHKSVHIYNFSEFLEGGYRKPYTLGEPFGENGRIGCYPTGLPLNFNTLNKPPLLFDVQCSGQVVQFGGFPYHYIIASAAARDNVFMVKSVEHDAVAYNGFFMNQEINDEPNVVTFHPDNSNRLLFRDCHVVHCYNLTLSKRGSSQLNKAFSMCFSQSEKKQQAVITKYGRSVRQCIDFTSDHDISIFSLDYEDELDIIGILGIDRYDTHSHGIIKLYDSFTGAEIKTVEMCQQLRDTNSFQLYIDMTNIIIIEKDVFQKKLYNIFVYSLVETLFKLEIEFNTFSRRRKLLSRL